MIQTPNEETRKIMMICARSRKNLNNSFFIEKDTGEIKCAAYRDERAYFPQYPEGTYEIHIQKDPFLSYSMLDAIIEAQMWGVLAEERMKDEEGV